MKKITITDPTNLFFATDSHFGHSNIIKHCDRPYPDVDTMDADMIMRWNSVVRKGSKVIYLGDITMNTSPDVVRNYMKQLNGDILYFVYGNHDLQWERATRTDQSKYGDMLLVEVHDGIDTTTIHCCHYPMLSWYKKFRGSWHLYGHVHNNEGEHPDANALNLCPEVHDYAPLSYAQIKEKIRLRNESSSIR